MLSENLTHYWAKFCPWWYFNDLRNFSLFIPNPLLFISSIHYFLFRMLFTFLLSINEPDIFLLFPFQMSLIYEVWYTYIHQNPIEKRDPLVICQCFQLLHQITIIYYKSFIFSLRIILLVQKLLLKDFIRFYWKIIKIKFLYWNKNEIKINKIGTPFFNMTLFSKSYNYWHFK